MGTYVSKSELSNAGYITSIPNTYASYTGVYSYLASIGITRNNNGTGASFIDEAYITDSELSGDILINGVSTSQLPTYAAISEMGYLTSIPSEYVTDTELSNTLANYYTDGEVDNEINTALSNYYTKTEINNASYVTSSDLPVINESIIPKETATYTLGDGSHIYSNTYSRGVYLGTGVRMYSESSASSNDIAIALGGTAYYYMSNNRFAPNGAANSEKIDLGTADRKWNHIYGKSVNVDTTYTSNLYTENVSYTSGKSSIKMNDRNVDIWVNNKKLINASDYAGVVPTQTNFNLGSSSKKWGSTYTTDLYADTIHNFIWTGTSAEYVALDNYTTYQIYLIQEA